MLSIQPEVQNKRYQHTNLACCCCNRRAYDVAGDRKLNFDEFSRLHFFLVNVQQSFATFDQARQGRLPPQAVDMALRQAGGRCESVPPAVLFFVCRLFQRRVKRVPVYRALLLGGGAAWRVMFALRQLTPQPAKLGPANLYLTFRLCRLHAGPAGAAGADEEVRPGWQRHPQPGRVHPGLPLPAGAPSSGFVLTGLCVAVACTQHTTWEWRSSHTPVCMLSVFSYG